MGSNKDIFISNITSFITTENKLKFPGFRMPNQVGEYCVSPDGAYENCGSRLYFVKHLGKELFPISLDGACNRRYADGEAKQTGTTERYLDNLFLFLRTSSLLKFNNLGNLSLDTEIVCSSQLLQTVMCSVYTKESWTIVASKYRNTIYMCQLPNQGIKSSKERLPQSLANNYMTMLRQHCLVKTDVDNDDNNANYRRDLSGQYYSVFTTNINGTSVLFNAPMLAEYDPTSFIGSPKRYVNLKLRPATMSGPDHKKHNVQHALKWWAESFLVGIEKVYIAYHDINGLVHNISSTTLRELYQSCQNEWSANVCVNFLDSFLVLVKNKVGHMDSASLVHRFDFTEETGCFTHGGIGECNEHSFIPDWYRIMMNENMDHLKREVEFHA